MGDGVLSVDALVYITIPEFSVLLLAKRLL